MAITATIGSNNSNGQKKVSVTVPVQQTLVRNADFLLRSLGDVDAVNAQEGALLQYRSSDKKFVTRTNLDTDQGTLTFNGGNF